MNRITAILLMVCVAISFCLVSCKSKQEEPAVSSQITYFETSSEIAKTEGDGNYTFNFDPYVLNNDVKKALKTTEHYKTVVDAIISQKESVLVPTREDYDNIRFALGENFPFAFAVSELKYDSLSNKVLISYNYKTEHAQKIEQVKKAIGDVLGQCVVKNDNEALAAVSIYNYLAKNIEIVEGSVKNNQNPVVSSIAQNEGSSISSTETQTGTGKYDFYTALVNKKATDESISALYNFLLMQLGIESKTVSCWQNNQYKSWNLVLLKSKWYYCDIAMEQKKTDGMGLKYFGMNTERLTSYVNSDISMGQWKWFSDALPRVKNKRFDDFKEVVNFEINNERTAINAFTEEYSRFSFEF